MIPINTKYPTVTGMQSFACFIHVHKENIFQDGAADSSVGTVLSSALFFVYFLHTQTMLLFPEINC